MQVTIRFAVGMAALSLAVSARAADEQAAADVSAQQAAGPPVALEVFTGPKKINMDGPGYPMSERVQGNEGWVHVNFMIDPNGKPYEIAVVTSTDNKAFEQSAIKAVEKWTFEPARLGDKPVHSGYDGAVTFKMDPPVAGANPSFMSAYQRLLKAIEAGERPLADQEIAALKVKSLYEDTWKNLASFHYHVKWGTEAQQIGHLRSALLNDWSSSNLPKEQFRVALNALMALEVKAKDFASALKTWETLQKFDPEDSKRWQGAADGIRLLQRDNRSYSVQGTINDRGTWFYPLLKNHFEIRATTGHVAEIKLRCEKQYVFFQYQPDLRYNIDAKYGNCQMELLGEPGTTVQLTQS